MPPQEFYDLLKRHHTTKLPVDAHAAHWMTLLGRDTPGSLLSEASMALIPMLGSHDSGTYGIHEGSELAADAPPAVKSVVRFAKTAGKRLVSYWSRTQSTTIIEQLLHGVRYFDIRISPVNKKRSEKLSPSQIASPNTPVKPPIPLRPSTATSRANPHFADDSQDVAGAELASSLTAVEVAQVSAIAKKAGEDNALIDSGEDEEDEKIEAEEPAPDQEGLVAYPPIVGYDADDEDDLWVSHGSLSIPLASMIEEIRIFYDQILPALGSDIPVPRSQLRNNLEIIVFDIQKVTAFTPKHVQQLVHMLRPLESLLVRMPHNMATPLKDLWQTSQRIFVLYPTHALPDVDIALSAVRRRRNPLTLPPGTPSTWECPKAYFHPRDDSMIRSHWYNKSQEVPLFQDLLQELQARSCVPPEDRTQLHVLQAILTPKAGDMVSAIMSKKPKASSILEFAMQVNSSILTMWEAHGQQHMKTEFPIRYRRQEKGGHHRIHHIKRRPSAQSMGSIDVSVDSMSSAELCIESPHTHPNNNSVVDTGRMSKPPSFFYSHSIEAGPNTVDARNVLMLDFIHIGRSASGLNAFYTACWYPCVDRFCRTIANPPRPLSEEGRVVAIEGEGGEENTAAASSVTTNEPIQTTDYKSSNPMGVEGASDSMVKEHIL